MCTPEDLELIEDLENKIKDIDDKLDELVLDGDFKRAVNGNDSVEVQGIKDRQEVYLSLRAHYERRLLPLYKRCKASDTQECPIVMRSYMYGY